MTTETATYTEQAFIADLQGAFEEHRAPMHQAHAVAAHLRRAFESGWPENSPKFGDGDGTYEVHRDAERGHPGPGFVVLAYRQPPQQIKRPAPHDHGVCWVVYGVKRGANMQTRYAYRYGGDRSQLPSFEKIQEIPQGPGDVDYFLPGEIHSVQGSTDEETVYVRITSMDLGGVQRHRYDVESGRSATFASATTLNP